MTWPNDRCPLCYATEPSHWGGCRGVVRPLKTSEQDGGSFGGAARAPEHVIVPDACPLAGGGSEEPALIPDGCESRMGISASLECITPDEWQRRALPVTPGGKLALVSDLLNPVDEDGNPLEPLITAAEALELLSLPGGSSR